MQKRIFLTGSNLRSRTLAHKRQLRNEVVEKAYPLIDSPRFQNMVRHRFSYKEAIKAHKLMESRDFMGKILLVFDATNGTNVHE